MNEPFTRYNDLTQYQRDGSHQSPQSTDGEAFDDPEDRADVPYEAGASEARITDGLRRRLGGAIAVALALVAAGLFCVIAKYVVPGAMSISIIAPWSFLTSPWGLIIDGAAPALLATGFGVIGGVLCCQALATSGNPQLHRAGMVVMGAVLLTAGFLCLFSVNTIRESPFPAGPGTADAVVLYPWQFSFAGAAAGLLIPGAAMMGCFVILQAWALPARTAIAVHETEAIEPESAGGGAAHVRIIAVDETGSAVLPETEFVPRTRPVSGIVWVVGAALTLAGIALLMAPYLFPDSMGGGSLESGNPMFPLQRWPSILSPAGPSFIQAGLILPALFTFFRIRSAQRSPDRSSPST
jgi:hypothetical protein